MKLFVSALMLAIGFFSTTTLAQSFTNKTTANGLIGNVVRSVYAVGRTIYVGTESGLSISTDGGSSFTNKTTGNGLAGNVVLSVYAVGSTIYVGTDGGGLRISTDGGSSFTNKTTANGLGSNFVLSVYAVGSTIYVGTRDGGLSISTDGGSSFTNKTISNGLGSNSVGSVYAVGSTIYAGTESGLSISADSPSPSPPPNSINATPSTGKVGVPTNFSYTFTYAKESAPPSFQISYSKTGHAPWKVIKKFNPYSTNIIETTVGTTVTRLATIGSYRPVATDVSKNGVIRVCDYSQSDLKTPLACISSPFVVSRR